MIPSRDFWLADDLARDLGFRGLTEEFWKWCDRHGIPRRLRLQGEAAEAVERALERQGRAG